MTRYVCLIESDALSQFRSEHSPRMQCNYPAACQPEGWPIPDGYAILHRFDAPDADSARRYYERMLRDGCPIDPDLVGVATAATWRFRGDVHHLKRRLGDAGLPSGTDRLVQANPQWRVLTTALGQLCETYHRSHREGGVATLAGQSRFGMLDSLRKAEEQVAVLGLLTMGAIDAVDAARRAFGEEKPRKFRIVVADDPGDEPAPDAGAAVFSTPVPPAPTNLKDRPPGPAIHPATATPTPVPTNALTLKNRRPQKASPAGV